MAIEIKAPAFPESVADGEVATWHKAEGDSVQRDELLVEIETDKVVMEVVAPESGVLSSIVAAEGVTIESEAVLAMIEPGAVAAESAAAAAPAASTDAAAEADDADAPMGPAVRQMLTENNLDRELYPEENW